MAVLEREVAVLLRLDHANLCDVVAHLAHRALALRL